MLATLRSAGFSLALTAHAYAIIDAFVYGFALQEVSLPFDDSSSAKDVAESMLASFPTDAYPSMIEFATEHVLQPDYSFGDSFDFGLEIIFGGLDAALEADRK